MFELKRYIQAPKLRNHDTFIKCVEGSLPLNFLQHLWFYSIFLIHLPYYKFHLFFQDNFKYRICGIIIFRKQFFPTYIGILSVGYFKYSTWTKKGADNMERVVHLRTNRLIINYQFEDISFIIVKSWSQLTTNRF